MSSKQREKLATVWLALSAITLFSWWIGSKHGHEFVPNALITCSAILLAAIKVRFIMRDFMEVKRAPVLLCRLTDAWILFVVVALLGIYGLKISIPPTI